MPVLEAIIKNLKPKEFSGTVRQVILVDGFVGPGNQYNRYWTGHGDRGGPNNKVPYTEGTYEVMLQGPAGEVKTFQHFYREPPKIGSQQTFRI